MTSPEHSPQPTHQETPEQLRGLTLDRVEELRNEQKKLVLSETEDVLHSGLSAQNEAKQRAYDSFDELNGHFLSDHGINEKHPKRDEYLNYLNNFSIDQIPEEEWYAGPYVAGSDESEPSDDGTVEMVQAPSGRDRLREAFGQLAEEAKETDGAAGEDINDTVEVKKSLDDLEKEIKESAIVRNQAYAERMRARLFGKDKKEAQKAFEEADATYIALVKQYETAKIEEYQALGTSAKEINSMLERRTNERFRADEEAKLQSMIEQGGRRAKWLNKFAGLSRGKKFAAVGVASLGLAVGGAGLMALAGATAAGVGAVAAGAGAASRFGRGYAVRLSRLYANKDDNQYPAFSLKNNDIDEKDALNKALSWMDRQSREEIESGDKTKKAAIAIGIGSVALGALVANAADVDVKAGDRLDAAGDKISGWWNDLTDQDGETVVVEEPEAPDESPDSDEVTGGANSWPRGGDPGVDLGTPDTDPNLPDVDVNVPDVEFSSEAQTISRGEGWSTTFAEMNIPASERAELLEKVGPGLVDMGIAYEDPSIGGYGINMTADGQMPSEALEYIQDSYDEMSETEAGSNDVNVENGTEADGDATNGIVADSAGTEVNVGYSADSVSPMSDYDGSLEITHGEGWSDTMREMGINGADRAHVLAEAGPQLAEMRYSDGTKVAYWSSISQEWFMNKSPDGQMPAKALHVIEHVAKAHGIAVHHNYGLAA